MTSRVNRSGPTAQERMERLAGRADEALQATARERAQAGSPGDIHQTHASFFYLERMAWTMVSMAELLIFELRLTPGSMAQPSKLIDTLVREGGLPLGDGRRVKQLLEYRTLSQREPEALAQEAILSPDNLDAVSEVLEIWNDFSRKSIS
jgi:hypothetical protein